MLNARGFLLQCKVHSWCMCGGGFNFPHNTWVSCILPQNHIWYVLYTISTQKLCFFSRWMWKQNFNVKLYTQVIQYCEGQTSKWIKNKVAFPLHGTAQLYFTFPFVDSTWLLLGTFFGRDSKRPEPILKGVVKTLRSTDWSAVDESYSGCSKFLCACVVRLQDIGKNIFIFCDIYWILE